MVLECGLEECGKTFDYAIINDCMNERKSIICVGLQSLRAPVNHKVNLIGVSGLHAQNKRSSF